MNRPLVAVHLHGPLGERFGTLHHFDIRSPQEAVRALDANYPGFLAAFMENERYGLMVDGDWRGGDTAPQLPASKEIHITPYVEGNTPLVVIALGFIGIYGTTATIIASILVTGLLIGVSLLFRPKPPEQKEQEEKDPDSFIFSGPENVTGQGVAVPLIYGRVFAGSVVVSAGQDTVDTITTPPAKAATKPATGSTTVHKVPGRDGGEGEVHPYVPTHGRDRSVPKRAALRAALEATPLATTSPETWLVTALGYGVLREDFTGQVGARIQLSENMTFNWLGTIVTPGMTGLHTVSLYEGHATPLLLRTVDVDMTGLAVDAWAWGSVAPVTLLAGVDYCVASTVSMTPGQGFYENGTVTMVPQVTTVTSVYRAGPTDAFVLTTPGSQYGGVDLGFSSVSAPIDPEDVLDPFVDMYNEGGGTDHLLDPPVEGWPAIVEDAVYGWRPEGWVLVKVVCATEEDDTNRKQIAIWQPDYETIGWVYNWNMVKGFYVTEAEVEYEEIVDGVPVTVTGMIATIEPEDEEWVDGESMEEVPIENPSP